MINVQVLSVTADLWRTMDEKQYWKSNKESDFEKHISETLTNAGLVVIKLPDETPDYVFPDLLIHCLMPGHLKYTFYIECKAASRRYRKSQKHSFKLFEPFVDIFPVRNGSEWVAMLEYIIEKAL